MLKSNALKNKKSKIQQRNTPSQGAAKRLQSVTWWAVLVGLIILPIHLSFGASPLDRLATAVRFKTVSSQDTSKIDYRAFAELNEFLASTYPKTFEQLDVEYINTYSILLRWAGPA